MIRHADALELDVVVIRKKLKKLVDSGGSLCHLHSMTIDETLKAIVPGKTYPAQVTVTEKDGTKVDFYLNSFFVGMYCAIHINGSVAAQNGDHNNKGFCTKLKKDIKKAIERGATVEIGEIRNCTLEMPK